ncbi:tigger transposable element-derived protein 6-like [Penaeus indicus]|uniref:tigger transposable element-derived protein 6-like n=1 Tax=Penaeus indicus TaxID=29960 RepID=UPI00300D48B0
MKTEDCKGGKVSKDRLTVMFTCSATGDKLKPLVIGKAAKPRCFRNIDVRSLPVTWTSNRKAWMTAALFTDWLKDVNSLMRRRKKKILLFLDNATSHSPDIRLSNVTLKFLPANTTSRLQPLDQGIIRAFKARCRKHLLRSVIAKIDDTTATASEVAKSVNVLGAVYMISRAWNETRESTITKCFAKAGFPVPMTADNEGSVSEEDQVQDEVADLIRQGSDRLGVDNIDPDHYIDFDNSMPTEETYSGDWERQLVDNFVADRENVNPAAVDDDDEVEPEPAKDASVRSNLTFPEVLQMLNQLQNFAADKDCPILNHIQDAKSVVEAAIIKQRSTARQSTIDSFFKR